jgi:N-acyl-D-amino-acid deacylase
LEYDLLVKGGNIVDGTGKKSFRGDLLVRDGRIAAIIPHSQEEISSTEAPAARETCDAAGLTVCPGFIDMHSHADWIFPLEEHPSILTPLMEQGITTLIGGNCGYSPAPLAAGSPHLHLIQDASDFLSQSPLEFTWDTMGSFLDNLERKTISLNLAMLSGHGTLRLSYLGKAHAYPGEKAMDAMEQLITESF